MTKTPKTATAATTAGPREAAILEKALAAAEKTADTAWHRARKAENTAQVYRERAALAQVRAEDLDRKSHDLARLAASYRAKIAAMTGAPAAEALAPFLTPETEAKLAAALAPLSTEEKAQAARHRAQEAEILNLTAEDLSAHDDPGGEACGDSPVCRVCTFREAEANRPQFAVALTTRPRACEAGCTARATEAWADGKGLHALCTPCRDRALRATGGPTPAPDFSCAECGEVLPRLRLRPDPDEPASLYCGPCFRDIFEDEAAACDACRANGPGAKGCTCNEEKAPEGAQAWAEDDAEAEAEGLLSDLLSQAREEGEAPITRVETFGDAGVLSRDRGLVLYLLGGGRIYLTIRHSR
jgi:hypothetical protein